MTDFTPNQTKYYSAEDGRGMQRSAMNIIGELDRRVEELETLLNKPELHDFTAAVVREAAHQNQKWGPTHDAEKNAHDWIAVISYLHGKQVKNFWDGDYEKYIHHIITMAAVCCNWHSHAVKLLPTPPEGAHNDT